MRSGKAKRRKITALKKDRETLQARQDKVGATLARIGGMLTEDEAKTLILKKLFDVESRQLDRYLNAEKRVLFHAAENLWDKYAVSQERLEELRTDSVNTLGRYLTSLRYLS